MDNNVKVGDWVYITKRFQEFHKNPISMCKDGPSEPIKRKVINIVHAKDKTLYQVKGCHFSDTDIGVSVFKEYDAARDNLKKKRGFL